MAGDSQTFEHPQANAVGVVDSRFDEQSPLVHFRGIKYASIAERFAAPVLLKRDTSTKLEATEFGPRCPQPPVDVRDLMQIPKDLPQHPPDREDEFECLNLNITMPKKTSGKLPVMIWIYGGAQIVSFSTAAARLCDPGRFAAQSISSGQPIILVTINYRLNILAYGDGKPNNETNLQLHDLQAGVHWVFNHISSFGGDTNRITISGESAGAILTHALCLTLPKSLPIHRAILCSGTLGSSAPQPPSTTAPVLARTLATARAIAASQAHPSAKGLTLRTCPIPVLVAAMAASGLNSIPLQQHPSLSNWQDPTAAFSRLSALMLGDCEYESILWLAAARLFPSSAVRPAFLNDNNTTSPDPRNQRLTTAYFSPPPTSPSPHPSLGHTALGLSPDKQNALSFMADHLFHLPNHLVARSLTSATSTTTPTKLYHYLFNEPNPFSTLLPAGQGVPRAHHAVDLLALWGNYDASFPANSTFAPIGNAFRSSILTFVNGDAPWTEQNNEMGTVYNFGPDGRCGEIDALGYQKARRTEQMKVMEEVGREVCQGVWERLIAEAAKGVAKAMEMAAKEAAKKKKRKEIQDGKKGGKL